MLILIFSGGGEQSLHIQRRSFKRELSVGDGGAYIPVLGRWLQKDQEVEVIISHGVSLRPASTASHPVLRKKQKTTNNNKTKAPTTTNPQNKKGKQRLPQLAFTSRVTFYGWVKSWVWFRGLQTDSSWCACLTGAIIIKRKRHLPFNYKTGIFFLITNITKFTTINLKKMSGACPSNRGTGLKPRLPSPCPSWQGCSMEM